MSQRELPDIPGLNLPNPATTNGGPIPATPPPMPPQFMAPPQFTPPAVQPSAPSPAPAVSDAPAPSPAAAKIMAAEEASHPTVAATTDEDLDDESVDEEWVNKAKAVVEQMQADPYTEAQTLNKLKAEYLQRRFGKKIKIDS
ncbi:MAG TPA: hypothetical protein VFI74_03210 [Candidatus Saccharimonadales bacterium]|nr:hypothetical protein [Candidatus Saccharimonadales bacterium]